MWDGRCETRANRRPLSSGTMTEPTTVAPASASRPITVRAIGVLLTALGINALVQVPQFLPGWGNDPWQLSLEQLLTGVAGVAAGVAAWRHRPTAWILTVVWGALTVLLLLSLPPLLELEPEAGAGIRYGSLVVVALTAWFAWYLRRATTGAQGTTGGRT